MTALSVDEESKLADDFVQVFVVKLHLEGAHNLVKADFLGKSDPYCVVHASGKTYSTKTIMKTLEPEWNEHTQFVLFEDPKQLEFHVWDWDKGTKDDKIGDCKLSLAGFFEAGHTGFDGEIALENVKKGRIKVKVSARKLLPVELETTHKRMSALKAKRTQEVADRTQQIATLDSEIEAQNNASDKTKGEIEAAQKKSAKMQAARNQLVKEAVQTQGELDAKKQKKTATDEELTQAKSELQPVLKDLAVENGNVKQLLEEKTALEKEIEDLKKEVQTKKRLKREAEERAAAAAAAADEKQRADKVKADKEKAAAEKAAAEKSAAEKSAAEKSAAEKSVAAKEKVPAAKDSETLSAALNSEPEENIEEDANVDAGSCCKCIVM